MMNPRQIATIVRTAEIPVITYIHRMPIQAILAWVYNVGSLTHFAVG